MRRVFYFESIKKLIISSLLALAFFSSFSAPAISMERGIVPVFRNSPSVEEYVRGYFSSKPIMAKIAWCESKFKHFGTNGDIIRGEINASDVGVMQINEFYHSKTADRLGYNLYSLNGNLLYADYLFAKEGTAPWFASSNCWSRENQIAKN